MITLLTGLVIAITNALQAVTGFGSTVLAIPFVTGLLGMPEGVALLTVLGWFIALYFVIVCWRDIDWKQYLIITVIAGLGLPLGRHFTHSMPIPTLKIVLASFIIGAATLQFVRSTRPAAAGGWKLPLPALASFLFLGGIVHGMFSSGGPLIVLYATRTLTDKAKFRATLCLLWTTLNPLIMYDIAQKGQFTTAIAIRLGIMLPFLAAGIVLGDRIHKRVNAVLFRKVVFMSLLVVGIFSLYNAIPRKAAAAPPGPIKIEAVKEAGKIEQPAITPSAGAKAPGLSKSY